MAKQDANDPPAASKPVRENPGTARTASNVWPLFGPHGAGGRGGNANPRRNEFRVDSAGLLRHDASPPASDSADATGSPKRRHTMPRLALEALGPEGLSRQQDAEGLADPSSAFDWNHAPNDRLAAEGRQSRLARTLEVDIIPRLVKVHRTVSGAAGAPQDGCPAPSAQDVEDFVQLILTVEHSPSRAFVETMQKRGMSTETLYLDLLAPAAQHLNYLWAQDLCDFTQVTLGLARLQRLLHELSPSMREEDLCRSNARRVLLMPVSGEHQTFGLSMLAEFFHHAGWEVDCGKSSLDDAAELVRLDWFDIVGLTAGIDTPLEALRLSIRNVRSRSRNKDIGVLVGGPIFAAHPERVEFVGADACGLDGKQALLHAEKLMAARGLAR